MQLIYSPLAKRGQRTQDGYLCVQESVVVVVDGHVVNEHGALYGLVEVF